MKSVKVKFKVNLGSRDAGALNLDHERCTAGSELEVREPLAKALAALNAIEELPPTLKAVPEKPAIAEAKPAEVKAEKQPARAASNTKKPAPAAKASKSKD